MVFFLLPFLAGEGAATAAGEAAASTAATTAAEGAATSAATKAAVASTTEAATAGAAETATSTAQEAAAAPVKAPTTQGPTASGATLDSPAQGGGLMGNDWFKMAVKLLGQNKKDQKAFGQNPLNRVLYNLGLVDKPTVGASSVGIPGGIGPMTPQQEQAMTMANILSDTGSSRGLLGTGVSAIRSIF